MTMTTAGHPRAVEVRPASSVVGRRDPSRAGIAVGRRSTIAHVDDTPDEPTQPDPRMGPLYEMAAEAQIERSTAWRWLRDGELGEAKRYPPDRRLYVARAAFLRALKAPRRRRRQRGGDG
jgi:hypothetical protein